VDDLVWHATPAAGKRLEFDTAAANTQYPSLNQASATDEFSYSSGQGDRKFLGVEILGTMAEAKNTALSQWLAGKGLTAQDVDVAVAKQAWQELYSAKEGGKARFLDDAAKRVQLPSGWRITGEYSEARAHDQNLPGSGSIQETPITLSTRRRANSTGSAELRKTRDANKGMERSFIRTWVRILRKDNPELSNSLCDTKLADRCALPPPANRLPSGAPPRRAAAVPEDQAAGRGPSPHVRSQ
jgi:hypothetical protein